MPWVCNLTRIVVALIFAASTAPYYSGNDVWQTEGCHSETILQASLPAADHLVLLPWLPQSNASRELFVSFLNSEERIIPTPLIISDGFSSPWAKLPKTPLRFSKLNMSPWARRKTLYTSLEGATLNERHRVQRSCVFTTFQTPTRHAGFSDIDAFFSGMDCSPTSCLYQSMKWEISSMQDYLSLIFMRIWLLFRPTVLYFWEYMLHTHLYASYYSVIVYVDSISNPKHVCYIVTLEMQRNSITKHDYRNRLIALFPCPTYINTGIYMINLFPFHVLSLSAIAYLITYGRDRGCETLPRTSLLYRSICNSFTDTGIKSVLSDIMTFLYKLSYLTAHCMNLPVCEYKTCNRSMRNSSVYTSIQSPIAVASDIMIFLYNFPYLIAHCMTLPICESKTCNINHVGGGKTHMKYADLLPHAVPSIHQSTPENNIEYRYVDQVQNCDGLDRVSKNPLLLMCRIAMKAFVIHITHAQAKHIAKLHHIYIQSKAHLSVYQEMLAKHECNEHCSQYVTLFAPHTTTTTRSRQEKWYRSLSKPERTKKSILAGKINASRKRSATYQQRRQSDNKRAHMNRKADRFPPSPPRDKLLHKLIDGFCEATQPSRFVESGCAVCGQITPRTKLLLLSASKCDLNLLINVGVTCMERKSESDPFQDIDGPVIDPDCNHICLNCHSHLTKGSVPPMALASGLWLGKVPDELSCLTFIEKLLISRIRHNRCIIRVASGRYKMRANAVTFQNPIPKIYNILPPPIKDLDEILAFIYTGPCEPTERDLERTPLLVRRTQVGKALNWLKLNHCDYHAIDISEDNLKEYPERGIPVVIDYRRSTANKDNEATSVHDNEDEDGAESGNCPFVVHGLTGQEFSTMRLDAIKAHALEHLMKGGKMLLIGHSKEPQSIYNNPQLFPAMLPWLFPYGLGGIGNTQHQQKLSSKAHKRHLLMYHDKRFQTDPHFPLIAFNHEQIKDCTTGGYLTTQKESFTDISDRLLNLDLNVLTDLNRRLSQKERVVPETESEKMCYKLITDLDVVGSKVQGSVTSKKHMRNEIWSLISFMGAPSWFITLSPADSKHPICLYFADKNEEFKPDIRLPDEAYRLVAHNPVAAARFFHFMCETFIANVLGVDQSHPGLFGNTSAYYGTVEQQGRLTLHMHLLLWIKQSLSPQEIRNRIMDRTSDFQKKMVEYLEAVHTGQFFDGSLSDVRNGVKESELHDPEYVDPTKTMPDRPPPMCSKNACDDDCVKCISVLTWWDRFKRTVDDLLFRSNVHSCRSPVKNKEGKEVKKGCLNNEGQCRARFPRDVVPETMVDPLTGALKVRKGEPWLNTFTPAITYLFRCNTDVTSLLSGTAIKVVVGYITDYVTKSTLNTYSVFDTIRQVFDRNSEMLGGTSDRRQKARSLMTKIVNALTAKMEIGSPMASLYLLGNPDHYTGHKFVHFYWANYVKVARGAWDDSGDIEKPETVVLNKNMGKYVGLSNVQDYVCRPRIYENFNLYEWIQMSIKSKRNPTETKKFNEKEKKKSERTCTIAEHVSEGEDELDMFLAPSNIGGGSLPLSASDEESDSDLEDVEEQNCEETDLNLQDSGEIIEEECNKYEFLADHPQYKTHQIHCDEERLNTVPNFIGGTLPRSDQGDREFYCSTMLTLFKPWRSGKKLKSNIQTWDESFLEYQFTKHERLLMEQFNLRYECNDARDDYSAKMKKESQKAGFFTSWADADTLEGLDNDNAQSLYSDGIEDSDYTFDENIYTSNCNSPDNDKKLRQMSEIEMVIKNAGWLDESPDGIDSIDHAQFRPTKIISGKEWHEVIQNMKQTILCDRNKNIPSQKDRTLNGQPSWDEVRIADASYLKRNFQAEQVEQQALIDETAREFDLNEEQERAFRIVANHATTKRAKQLKMYLGGMGGTGKSQVFKALISFFKKRNESHRIMVLAPTGTAAAILNGSTYHSALGIPIDGVEEMRSQFTALAQVRTRLEGVDYIFLDEISMVACHSLYKISAQLAKVRNEVDEPFGGVNMIFAGDFAQLKPVGGAALYSTLVGTCVDASQSIKGQQAAIGKALWHQVTTVVILRKNMRQTTQSEGDAKLRTALENMRYGACTVADVRFLRSRIAGKRPEQPKLAEKRFRNVSVITAWNSHKDKLNQLGSERFASETKQKLTHFYSIDSLGKCHDPAVQKKRGRRKKTTSVKQHKISPILEDVLWNLRHSASDHVPGKLSLCIGMPVMIKNNDATELCVTKGQEGHVVGWQSAQGPSGQLVLETLFVKLSNPSRTIKIDGLPDNVVPLTKTTKLIECICPSDLKLQISRGQVQVLPNFSMTDYASQGKTRPDNVVDLNNCRDHSSYYTCLSRSSSCEGTVLIQGFDESKITKGVSGYLRQEFREHEILDEISEQLYNGTLPSHINGNLRNSLIRQYQLLKGAKYVPNKTPFPLKWTQSDPMNTLPVVTDTPWTLITSRKTTNMAKPQTNTFVPASGSIHLTVEHTNLKKRKIDVAMDEDAIREPKKSKRISDVSCRMPIGLMWDEEHYSCAYDAIFTIFCDIWISKPVQWNISFGSMSAHMMMLSNCYQDAVAGKYSLEKARNKVRRQLYQVNQNMFPYGKVGTSISNLATTMLSRGTGIDEATRTCVNCNKSVIMDVQEDVLYNKSVNQWFKRWQNNSDRFCTECSLTAPVLRRGGECPSLILFNLDASEVKISKFIKIRDVDQKNEVLPLRGIVYGGGFHFTCRIISTNKDVWYHDGMVTKRKCMKDGHLTDFTEENLRTCRGRNVNLLVYAK